MATSTITRVAIYARVSTTGNGQSPDMQLRELREYCQRRGWTVAENMLTPEYPARKTDGQNSTN